MSKVIYFIDKYYKNQSRFVRRKIKQTKYNERKNKANKKKEN